MLSRRSSINNRCIMTTQNSFPDLSGRVVLVTGASSGLGVAFAKSAAAAGASVVLAARRADRLADVQAEIVAAGGTAAAVEMDVTDEASVAAGFDPGEKVRVREYTVPAFATPSESSIVLVPRPGPVRSWGVSR